MFFLPSVGGRQVSRQGGKASRQEAGSPVGSGAHPPGICVRALLEEMGGDAARVATAVFLFLSGLFHRLFATGIADVILHAQQSVGVVVMRCNGHAQHNHADHQQKVCYAPL